MRVALMSGGKDSIYASLLYGDMDLFVILVYEFPRPSPHILNIGKSVETLLLMQVPTAVVKLSKGKERAELVRFLRRLKTNVIVAGDVYVEDHLKYMQSVADDVGAKLVEPLWGLEPTEVLYKEMEYGINALIIGSVNSLSTWLGKELNVNNVREFISYAKALGVDPLGERGEYHTLVTHTPKHIRRLTYEIVRIEEFDEYLVTRVI